jgi:hypothetical protein
VNPVAITERIYFVLGLFDSHKCYDAKSNTYTIPVTGRYIVERSGVRELYLLAGDVLQRPGLIFNIGV